MCGEKGGVIRMLVEVAGSPPRVRGKGCGYHFLPPLSRITPACAGKRRPTTMKIQASQDHPRVCGEKGNSSIAGRQSTGSPPRVRGKGLLALHGRGCTGITPACAGKRHCIHASIMSCEDHPRVCGEKAA